MVSLLLGSAHNLHVIGWDLCEIAPQDRAPIAVMRLKLHLAVVAPGLVRSRADELHIQLEGAHAAAHLQDPKVETHRVGLEDTATSVDKWNLNPVVDQGLSLAGVPAADGLHLDQHDQGLRLRVRRHAQLYTAE